MVSVITLPKATAMLLPRPSIFKERGGFAACLGEPRIKQLSAFLLTCCGHIFIEFF